MIKEYKQSGYFVSDDGLVYSTNSRGKDKSLKQLAVTVLPNGYQKVILSKIGEAFYVHRLVAILFIDNPENKPQVNHKDFNKTNNSVENLEWVSQEENCRHFRHNSRSSSGKTSCRRGTFYCGNSVICNFNSLQDAKKYCRSTLQCSLSTIGTRNVNLKKRIAYIRDSTNMDIETFWQIIDDQRKQFELIHINENKKTLGLSCDLFENDKFVASFASIREANEYTGLNFGKRNNYKIGKYKLVLKTKCND